MDGFLAPHPGEGGPPFIFRGDVGGVKFYISRASPSTLYGDATGRLARHFPAVFFPRTSPCLGPKICTREAQILPRSRAPPSGIMEVRRRRCRKKLRPRHNPCLHLSNPPGFHLGVAQIRRIFTCCILLRRVTEQISPRGMILETRCYHPSYLAQTSSWANLLKMYDV